MRAVTVGPVGFVAVGANIADDGALAWVSPDGTTWTSVPDAVSLHAYGLPIRMLSVTPVGDALVAVGWKSDAGNGSGVAWASRDGLDWLRAPEASTLFGAEMAGVTATATVIVGVGTLGYPDNDAAAVWLSGR